MINLLGDNKTNLSNKSSSEDDEDMNSNNAKQNGRWTDEEHAKFICALKMYGKNWNRVHKYVGTRTSAQTRSHAQKYFNKLIKYKELGEELPKDSLEHLALIGYGQGKTVTSPRN